MIIVSTQQQMWSTSAVYIHPNIIQAVISKVFHNQWANVITLMFEHPSRSHLSKVFAT